MPTIKLAYGKEKLSIKIPRGLKFKIVETKTLPPIRKLKKVLNEALNKPISSPPFDRLFIPGNRVAIVIPDKTRRGYFPPILEVLLARLKSAGISFNDMTILIARGMHPAHSPEELKELVGEKLYSNIKIIDHESRDPNQLESLGKTSYGTEVKLNKALLEADKIITLGVIQYHYFAGFCGGRKLILPGVAGYETIKQNHRLVLNPEPEKGKNPAATLGKLSGNPVHEDMIETIQMLRAKKKEIFSIDLLLNHKQQVAKIFVGDIIKAHEKGCQFFAKAYSVRLPQPADFIITSAGGFPTDINFIQSHKTLEHASKGLKEGGVLLALAECSQGIGSETFLPWFKYNTPNELEMALRENFEANGHTALCSLIKAQKFRIYLYSKLPHELIKQLRLNPINDLQETVNKIISSLSPRARVLIIPQGFVNQLIVAR